MEFSRQESWGGLPFPSPGDLPDPGIEPKAPALQADSLPLCHLGSHGEIKSPSVWLSTNSSQYSPQMERGPAGQVRAEQAAPVSTRNSVLPATSRVTQGSAGVMKMDQEGSISRQALRTHQSVCGLIQLTHPTYSQRTGVGRGYPLGAPQEGSQDIPLCPPF